jgi:hypothetical protein
MTTLHEAAQQALEALEAGPDVDPIFAGETEVALRAALEQPEQEPVAWMTPGQDLHLNNGEGFRFSDWTPLYTHPPRREWRGLTEEEIQSVIQLEREKRFQRRPPLPLSMTELSRAIEAKLKEKNHE